MEDEASVGRLAQFLKDRVRAVVLGWRVGERVHTDVRNAHTESVLAVADALEEAAVHARLQNAGGGGVVKTGCLGYLTGSVHLASQLSEGLLDTDESVDEA
ncbi:hypothetical protein GCM10027074_60130 [Streptomyces deserti]